MKIKFRAPLTTPALAAVFGLLAASSVFAAPGAAAPDPATTASRPNVVILFADDTADTIYWLIP